MLSMYKMESSVPDVESGGKSKLLGSVNPAFVYWKEKNKKYMERN